MLNMDSAKKISCESQLIVTIHDIHFLCSIKIRKRLASRYHPSRLCKGIRQSSTPPPSTQARILWCQPQNQQIDTIVLREQNAECNTWRDCLQASFSTLVYPKLQFLDLYCSWHTSTTCQRQQLHPRSNRLQTTAFFIVLLTTRLTVTYCRGILQF